MCQFIYLISNPYTLFWLYFYDQALQAEINAASDADETTAFRPLMPRSLRGGGARATLPSTSSAGDACPGGKQAEVGNDKAKRPRNEKNNASSDGGDCGAGGGIGSGGDDSCSTSTIAEAAAPGASGKKSGYGRRKTDKSDSDKDPVLPGPPGVVITGVTSGSGADGHSRDAGALERVKAESLGASVDDSATDIDGRSTDEIASAPAPPAAESAAVPAAASAIGATAASAVAAGTVAAAAAADAKVLSGCAVSLRCEDFVAEDHGDHGYDVICLFSIVKWIHINGGDEALREVFQKAYGLLQHGGRLVLEPQVQQQKQFQWPAPPAGVGSCVASVMFELCSLSASARPILAPLATGSCQALVLVGWCPASAPPRLFRRKSGNA